MGTCIQFVTNGCKDIELKNDSVFGFLGLVSIKPFWIFFSANGADRNTTQIYTDTEIYPTGTGLYFWRWPLASAYLLLVFNIQQLTLQ